MISWQFPDGVSVSGLVPTLHGVLRDLALQLDRDAFERVILRALDSARDAVARDLEPSSGVPIVAVAHTRAGGRALAANLASSYATLTGHPVEIRYKSAFSALAYPEGSTNGRGNA